jgi:hypothetical protein
MGAELIIGTTSGIFLTRRRILVTKNFREIHAAIEKAFPLVEVLQPTNPGGN